MILSRGCTYLKLLNNSRRALKSSHLIPVRLSSGSRYVYRGEVQFSPKAHRFADFLGTVMWGWIFYHFINNYDAVTGEFASPDPKLWTDEELGIPPDSEGPYVK